MIEYIQSGLDKEVIDLLNIFEKEYVTGLLRAYENNAFAIRKVYLDKVLQGIILIKGVTFHNGEKALEVCHVIGNKSCKNFCEILGQSIEQFTANSIFEDNTKFDYVFFHTQGNIMLRVMHKYFDTPTECIFKRKVSHLRIKHESTS